MLKKKAQDRCSNLVFSSLSKFYCLHNVSPHRRAPRAASMIASGTWLGCAWTVLINSWRFVSSLRTADNLSAISRYTLAPIMCAAKKLPLFYIEYNFTKPILAFPLLKLFPESWEGKFTNSDFHSLLLALASVMAHQKQSQGSNTYILGYYHVRDQDFGLRLFSSQNPSAEATCARLVQKPHTYGRNKPGMYGL